MRSEKSIICHYVLFCINCVTLCLIVSVMPDIFLDRRVPFVNAIFHYCCPVIVSDGIWGEQLLQLCITQADSSYSAVNIAQKGDL